MPRFKIESSADLKSSLKKVSNDFQAKQASNNSFSIYFLVISFFCVKIPLNLIPTCLNL